MITSNEDRTIQLVNTFEAKNPKDTKKETIVIRNNPQKGIASIVIQKGHHSTYFDLSSSQLEAISKRLQEWFEPRARTTVAIPEKKKFKLF